MSHKKYNNGCLANKPTQETAMNHGTKTTALPDLTANLLRDGMRQANGISDVRSQIIANAMAIDHATRLWHVFHAVIAGELDEVKTQLGDILAQVMGAIERHVENFFVQTLQLDIRMMRLEAM
jgi:hypothetical protein